MIVQEAATMFALPPIIQSLRALQISDEVRDTLRLRGFDLTLRRAWPRSGDHLTLEYITGDGQIVPARWFRDQKELEGVARKTARVAEGLPARVAICARRNVLLQVGGADYRLPGLAPLAAQAGATLLVHRPERRAVLRLEGADGTRYAKVVRPARAAAVAESHQSVQRLARGRFAVPDLLDVDHRAGVLRFSALPGQPLTELSGGALKAAAEAVGRTLRAFHSLRPPSSAVPHRVSDEAAVLVRWIEWLESFGAAGTLFREQAAGVIRSLVADAGPAVLLHRDFYDKQIFVDEGGSIGLLDFDTLSTGEAALDLANALVHLELRVLQGRFAFGDAQEAAVGLLQGYAPDRQTIRRLTAYAGASRLRLACVYAFRPAWSDVVAALLGPRGGTERQRLLDGLLVA